MRSDEIAKQKNMVNKNLEEFNDNRYNWKGMLSFDNSSLNRGQKTVFWMQKMPMFRPTRPQLPIELQGRKITPRNSLWVTMKTFESHRSFQEAFGSHSNFLSRFWHQMRLSVKEKEDFKEIASWHEFEIVNMFSYR